MLRNLAHGAIVGYPGSPGYKLLDECSLAELRRCYRARISQIRAMGQDTKAIFRRMHKLELVEQT